MTVFFQSISLCMGNCCVCTFVFRICLYHWFVQPLLSLTVCNYLSFSVWYSHYPCCNSLILLFPFPSLCNTSHNRNGSIDAVCRLAFSIQKPCSKLAPFSVKTDYTSTNCVQVSNCATCEFVLAHPTFFMATIKTSNWHYRGGSCGNYAPKFTLTYDLGSEKCAVQAQHCSTK